MMNDRTRAFGRTRSVRAGLAIIAAMSSACGSAGGNNDETTPDGAGPKSPDGSSGGSPAGSEIDAAAGGADSSSSGVTGPGSDSSAASSQDGGDAAGSATSGATGTFYVSPTGTGAGCSSAAPCSITQAQAAVWASVGAMQSDIVVDLADGTYSLTAPLVFTPADSGRNGHTVIWQAAAGAHPVLSGAKRISNWTLSDQAKNIWKASAPSAFATRELYVAGKIATRARSSSPISRSDLTVTAQGFTFTNSALSYLNTLAHPERVELNAIGSWTNRYSPIQSVANNSVTMVQPAWEENTWGYDTVQTPLRQGPIYVENDSTLLDQPGEWYQDTTAGMLYYIPLTGQDMSSVDVELPQLQLLLSLGGVACPSDAGSSADGGASGCAYDQPAQNLTFSGLTFSYTSWLGPNSSDGFADEQTGGFVVGPRSLYPEFEATRPAWHQVPAAVQVSAAKNISFVRDRFVALGSVALGIGNDPNAHASGVGLGADTIAVTGCVFSQIAGGGIVVGGIQAPAHHPGGDVPLSTLSAGAKEMMNQNITISDNLVHDIGIDYRDFAGIMLTYTQNAAVTHNEVYNVPYSAINTGYGWGTNDAGGNSDYKTRASGDLYKYQPLYQNPTIAQNNKIEANYVHQGMLQMNDGGCHYNLSANPGTTITGNYCNAQGSGLSGLFWGEYDDEGSSSLTITQNIYASFGSVVTANWNASNNTGHLTFTNNWVNGSANPTLNGPANVVSGNISITGSAVSGFPAAAQVIANAAGLEPAYADLKNNP